MRRANNLWVVIVLLIGFTLANCSDAKKTTKKEIPAKFIKELSMPEFTLIRVPDSSSIESKDIPKEGIVLLKYFSPDCNHCQDEALAYAAKKDSLSNIKTLWMSGDWANLKQIQEFSDTYKIDQTHPIAVGKNHKSSLILYYNITGVPFAAVYKDNQLIQQYKGDVDFKELIAINNGTFVPQPTDSLLKFVQKKPDSIQRN